MAVVGGEDQSALAFDGRGAHARARLPEHEATADLEVLELRQDLVCTVHVEAEQVSIQS
ncbi:hypothetical protein [Nocardia implantans]|uniref:Uncharacterized protein n=1 Tax=Nocardia implantans TaxID=3108168 RepID=A0ABU6AWM3_9NOCA|nr:MULTISPECIES: hypothetical protein [unclassified Nocardia]MBF6193970.1 hypothetical protein [Nocardia beijingensis]MEA3529291.1 hypothetical protein [Nocardia sp. CDC192]MEB3511877.1 hypothetical protein [Nocardia sp. CDC186]